MKRIFSTFLSFLVVFSLMLPVYASSLDFSDLSVFGIEPLFAHHPEKAPVCDGKRNSDEYGSSTLNKADSGLFLLSRSGSGEAADAIAPLQKSFISLYEDIIYSFVEIELGWKPTPFSQKGMGSVYALSLSLGMTEDAHPTSRASLLTNTYYFSPDSLQCAGVSGERISRSVSEGSRYTLRISSTSEKYKNAGFRDASGTVWTAEHYQKHAFLSLSEKGGRFVLTAEFAIPAGDVLLSVPSNERDQAKEKLFDQKAVFCGSFSTQLYVSADTRLAVGLSPDADYDGAKIRDRIPADFDIPAGGVFIPKVIPLPLYWQGAPAPSSALQSSQVPSAQELPIALITQPSPAEDDAAENGAAPPTTTPIIPEGDDGGLVEDESLFDDLPDDGDSIPEETKLVYDENEDDEADEDEKESSGSLIGSLFTFVAGILLIVAVIFLHRFMLKEEEKAKKEEEEKKKQKQKKKKD